MKSIVTFVVKIPVGNSHHPELQLSFLITFQWFPILWGYIFSYAIYIKAQYRTTNP